MLRLEHISKIYPTGEVLKDVELGWLSLGSDWPGGGKRGGKSTQLKIVTGEIEPTTGDIIRPQDLRICLPLPGV